MRSVEVPLLPDEKANGGYFEPPDDVPARYVSARHDACGAETRVRLPESVPARAVRRLRCSGCEQEFDAAEVSEARRSRSPKLDPQGRGWKLASIPIAAVAVIAALIALQGGGDEPSVAPIAPSQAGETPAADSAQGSGQATAGASKPSKHTKLVRGSSYSLALPAGWERVAPPGGATFAAISADGDADATLWVDEDPKLDFPRFVDQSLEQLQGLAGSARIVGRVPAPTPEGTIVQLAADAPEGQPSYEVTLRASGPYRYYLATSVQPGSSVKTAHDAELIAGSFTPEAGQ